MDNIDKVEGIPSLMENPIFHRLEKRFSNIFCHNNTTTNMVPDSIYIYNSIEVEPLYEPRIVTLDIDSSGMRSGQDSMVSSVKLDITFKLRDGRLIGYYAIQENALVLADITHTFNDYTVKVFEKILDWLDANTPEKINSLIDAIKPRDVAYLTIGNTDFMLRAVSKARNNKDGYVEEVNKKAQHIIQQIKSHWINQYRREKERMERLRKALLPMPNITFGDIITNKVMIAKVESKIIYAFIVDIVVDGAINEMEDKRISMDTPKEYKDHLLVFYVNSDNKIDSPIRFLKPDGNKCDHLHTTTDGHLCTGTTHIIGQKIAEFSQLVSYKNTLLSAMKTINITSCFSSSDRTLYTSLVEKFRSSAAGTLDNSELWTAPRSTE